MKKLKHTKVKRNFKYPKIKASDRTYGVSLGNIIRENGDWRDFLPPLEIQNINGVESSACYVWGSQNAISVIQEEQFNLPDQNYSARFNALLSNGTEQGGDPVAAGKSMKYDGLVFEEDMPFKDISNWDEYHSWKGVDMEKVRAKAKEFLEKWSLNFKILSERDTPLKTKYLDLREALKRSPVPLSVCAWYEANGEYYKPSGKRDNHFVLALYVDDKDRIHILDTYAPNLKILAPKTNFEFALTWVVEKKADVELRKGLIRQAIEALLRLVGLMKEQGITELPKPPVIAPQPQPEPIKTKREIILEEARAWRGKDASPLNNAPQDLACAESVSYLLRRCGYSVPLLVSTIDLNNWLNKNFKLTTEWKAGNIIMSPTGSGNGSIVGHVGICDENTIWSNDSATGLWLDKYTLQGWIRRWRTLGGMPLYYYNPDEKA